MTINCATRSLNASISTTNRTNFLVETVIETILDKTTEETGVLEHGESIPNVPITSVNSTAAQNIQQSNAQPNMLTNAQAISESYVARARGRGQGRGRERRSFYRNTDENDPYDMSIAPLNLFENQVIPIGLHNLSKSFRPNISTIQVLSLGTKFISKWKFEKRNNALIFYKDFIRRM